MSIYIVLSCAICASLLHSEKAAEYKWSTPNIHTNYPGG